MSIPIIRVHKSTPPLLYEVPSVRKPSMAADFSLVLVTSYGSSRARPQFAKRTMAIRTLKQIGEGGVFKIVHRLSLLRTRIELL